MVRTTSTSFINGTGLKKCSPINRSDRLTDVNNSVTEIEEVFEAKIAPFFTIPSSDAYIFFFSSTFSIMASMMMSQLARSDLFVVPPSTARIASFRGALWLAHAASPAAAVRPTTQSPVVARPRATDAQARSSDHARLPSRGPIPDPPRPLEPAPPPPHPLQSELRNPAPGPPSAAQA